MCAWVSAASILAVATSASQTTRLLDYIARNQALQVRVTNGTTLQVLQWFIFVFSSMFAAGISTMCTIEGGHIQLASAAKPHTAQSGDMFMDRNMNPVPPPGSRPPLPGSQGLRPGMPTGPMNQPTAAVVK